MTGRTGTAAGVPYLALPPTTPGAAAPVVIAWHLLDPPRTPAAFASAIPLDGLDAWRIYLGLPMTGDRIVEGGPDELVQLAFADGVLNVHGPITAQAEAEFEPAVLLVVGEQDKVDGFREPAYRVQRALADCYADPSRTEVRLVAGMGHALAEEPGLEPTPQTAHAAETDALASAWFRRFLC